MLQKLYGQYKLDLVFVIVGFFGRRGLELGGCTGWIDLGRTGSECNQRALYEIPKLVIKILCWVRKEKHASLSEITPTTQLPSFSVSHLHHVPLGTLNSESGPSPPKVLSQEWPVKFPDLDSHCLFIFCLPGSSCLNNLYFPQSSLNGLFTKLKVSMARISEELAKCFCVSYRLTWVSTS